jgi:ribose/xylose/arabinose/galactoside ABC-type transport system permease subunit
MKCSTDGSGSAIYGGSLLLMTLDLVVPILGGLMPLFVLALATSVVFRGGGVDLSLISIMHAASLTGGWLMTTGQAPVWAGVAAMLGMGLVLGLINGLAIARFELPPAMVTLTSLLVISGASAWGPTAPSRSALPDEFTLPGGHLAAAAGVAVAVGAVVHLLMQKHVFGRWLQAIGLNPQAARASGLQVASILVGLYGGSGLLAAVAAIIEAGPPPHQPSPTGWPGMPLLLEALTAALISAWLLRRQPAGRWHVWTVVAGAMIMAPMDPILTAAGIPASALLIVKIAVILAAAATLTPGQGVTAWRHSFRHS